MDNKLCEYLLSAMCASRRYSLTIVNATIHRKRHQCLDVNRRTCSSHICRLLERESSFFSVVSKFSVIHTNECLKKCIERGILKCARLYSDCATGNSLVRRPPCGRSLTVFRSVCREIKTKTASLPKRTRRCQYCFVFCISVNLVHASHGSRWFTMRFYYFKCISGWMS